jgi:hypothetical protein
MYRSVIVAIIAVPVSVLSACASDTPTASRSIASCSPSGVESLQPFHAARVDCADGVLVQLAGAGARYLVVPNLAAGNVPNQPVGYALGIADDSARAPGSRVAASALRLAPTRPLDLQRAFDFMLRARDRATASTTARPTQDLHLSVQPIIPPLGSVRSFHVLSSFDGSHFTDRDARLAYIGNRILLYQDTSAPPDGYTTPQLQSLGALFDNELYTITTQLFGEPDDIDQNGRVIVLLSPAVNAITPSEQCGSSGFVAGFFFGPDLGSVQDPHSNHGEIFYAIVPDPAGTVSCGHTVVAASNIVPSTFAHELQHMINYSRHVLLHRVPPEEGWLDEGLSLVAEEQGARYYEQRFPAPSGRTNPAQLFPDSAGPFITGVLNDSYSWLLDPELETLTLHSDADGGLAWRGADWLLLRWLGDQFDSTFYRRLVDGTATGVANIAQQAGEPFPNLFSDFALSLYTDSLPGVARSEIPLRDRFRSRNLRRLYKALYDANGGDPTLPRPFPLEPMPLPVDANVQSSLFPGSMAYYELDTPPDRAIVTLRFSTPTGGLLPRQLRPQVSVFRLP